MTTLDSGPNHLCVGNMPDVAGHGTAKQKIKEDARDSLVQFYREQPLLAGSLGIAMGAASDHSVDAARSEAMKKYDEVRESARSD